MNQRQSRWLYKDVQCLGERHIINRTQRRKNYNFHRSNNNSKELKQLRRVERQLYLQKNVLKQGRMSVNDVISSPNLH